MVDGDEHDAFLIGMHWRKLPPYNEVAPPWCGHHVVASGWINWRQVSDELKSEYSVLTCGVPEHWKTSELGEGRQAPSWWA